MRSTKSCEELKANFPAGVDYAIPYDTTTFVRDSIRDVVKTLFEAIGLVALVVLVFLQNWRASIVPLLAIPVSIVGTFAVMAVFGFSLNNLSMFGLVLAIGIVVDDAIVVVENVDRWIEAGAFAARCDVPSDGRSDAGGYRDCVRADGGVRARRVYQRNHGAVLPAIRVDDFVLDAAVGV